MLTAWQARQLESLIRLAEARARVDLAPTVTCEHAEVRYAAIVLSGLTTPARSWLSQAVQQAHRLLPALVLMVP